MEAQTRQLLSLLSGNAAAAILAALVAGDRKPDEIATAADMPSRTVSHVLKQLAAHGIVRCTTVRTGKRGSPGRVWSLVRAVEIAEFGMAADQFMQRLLDLQADEHRQSVAANRRAELRLLPDPDVSDG